MQEHNDCVNTETYLNTKNNLKKIKNIKQLITNKLNVLWQIVLIL